MRIVFFGSGAFAIPSLEALVAAGHDVTAVVTQPDEKKGRGQVLSPPPVKPVAEARGIRVLQPPKVREGADSLRALAPEIQVVVAYGQILPSSVLGLPHRGSVNVHASLLPRHRGAAPIQWAILKGDEETGVTTMLLDRGMDTGPILLQKKTPIGSEETAAALGERLAVSGAALLLETLRRLEEGSLRPTPQDSERATLAPLLRKEDSLLDFRENATNLARRVRALNPWPGTATRSAGRGLKILTARVEGATSEEPGTVFGIDSDGVLVACGGESSLRLLDVQPESGRKMSSAAFARGGRLRLGDRLG
jgi:methionyl-tRNA formyltransferase